MFLPNQNKKSEYKFNYVLENVSVEQLTIHPLLEKLGFDAPDELFIEEATYFNHLNIPVVLGNGSVLTDATGVLAAKQMGMEMIKAMVIRNMEDADIVRFINFKNCWRHGVNRQSLYNTITFLKDHLKNDEKGKEWAKELPGDKTRQKIATVLGVSEGTIHNIETIGKNNPDVLKQIDKKEVTNSDAQKEIKTTDTFQSYNPYKNVVFDNMSATAMPAFTVTDITLTTKELGKLTFSINTDTAAFDLNGKTKEQLRHEYLADTDPKDKRIASQYHVLLPDDDRFSFHFILRSMQNV